ncbi:MAG: hypothetical protein Q8Q02_16920 [Nocardioides sp.]|nr:hypothetical protein [Nocardioides sp.]
MKLPSVKPTPSFVISVLALTVSLGGTSAYAMNTIGSRDIKNDSIRSIDVKNGTLRVKDMNPNAVKRLKGRQGAPGAAGPAGVGRWALVDADGQIEAQSGGFEVVSAYDVVNNTTNPDGTPGSVPAGAFGNVYIDANEDLSNNGIVAVIALQNQVDQNDDGIQNGRAPGPDANPEFSGEITATMCGIAGVVGCAPTGANTMEHLVVSPRLSDGSLTDDQNRKRFYVIVAGDSSDYVPPAR